MTSEAVGRSRSVFMRKVSRSSFPFVAVVVIYLVLWALTSRTKHHARVPFKCRDGAAPGSNNNNIKAPKPMIVVAAGGQRAGSTVLYNALRILMRIRDPNLVSNWHADLTEMMVKYGDAYTTTTLSDAADEDIINTKSRDNNYYNISNAAVLRDAGFSVLVKVHTVADWALFAWGKNAGERGASMGFDVDAVYTSHRDVREVVKSVRRMRWGARLSMNQLDDPSFCVVPQSRPSPWLLEEEYARNPEVWVRLARAQLTCRQRLLEAAGSALKDDLEVDADLRGLDLETTSALLRRLAKHLDYDYTDYQIEAAAKELLALRAPLCTGSLNVHPVTQLHRAHISYEELDTIGNAIRKEDTALTAGEKKGIEAIENDVFCRRWLDDNGYIQQQKN